VRGHATYVPGVGLVPCVPGDAARSVTGNGQKVVTREYKSRISRAYTRKQSRRVAIARWESFGLLAVIAVLALAVIADGGTLLLIARLR